MGGDADAPQKASNYDEIFMHQSLQFAESLKDLKNLREQLYSAADYFESSYDKDDHQQLVIESSKDYVTKALVSTVDHLGSMANKLNKLLDKKANEFTATNIRFTCIHQRLSTFQGLNVLRGRISQEWLIIEAPKHNKQYNVQECSEKGKSKLIRRNCRPDETCQSQSMQDNQALSHKFSSMHDLQSRRGSPPNPSHFSYTRVMSKKETVSPLGFPLKRSASLADTSFSPTSSHNRNRGSQSPSVFRSAVILDTKNKDRDISDSYTKRGKHLFKALFNSHLLTKGKHKLQITQR